MRRGLALLLFLILAAGFFMPWPVYRVRLVSPSGEKILEYNLTGYELFRVAKASMSLGGELGEKLAPFLLYPLALLGVFLAVLARSDALLALSSLTALGVLAYFYMVYDSVLRMVEALGLSLLALRGVAAVIDAVNLGVGFYVSAVAAFALLLVAGSGGGRRGGPR